MAQTSTSQFSLAFLSLLNSLSLVIAYALTRRVFMEKRHGDQIGCVKSYTTVMDARQHTGHRMPSAVGASRMVHLLIKSLANESRRYKPEQEHHSSHWVMRLKFSSCVYEAHTSIQSKHELNPLQTHHEDCCGCVIRVQCRETLSADLKQTEAP